MTKADLEDEYWHEFLLWCAAAPSGRSSALMFWLDHNAPIHENFWEWVVKFKEDVLRGAADSSS